MSLRTVTQRGLKIRDHDDAYLQEHLVVLEIPRDATLVECANYRTLCHHIDDAGEGFEDVQTSYGRAILIPPDAEHAREIAIRGIFIHHEGRILCEEDYHQVVREAVHDHWRVMQPEDRLRLCLRTDADPALSTDDDPTDLDRYPALQRAVHANYRQQRSWA